ncbi:hypothetical protein [Phaffia rhodozyma]|uniref:Distal membrane-arm assembly complex protein 1-like domain-containing protein n=1 Tax=Phaffia rhodozyma TaxID=264483 RepID=A0A0F7SLZ0_PHARH|nr:hypothetical protein [Phaffia rhodozyma]
MSGSSSNISSVPMSNPGSAPNAPELEDCAACRIIGGTTFIGIGSYAAYQSLSLARAERRAAEALSVKNGLNSPPVRKGLIAMGVLGIVFFAAGVGRLSGLRMTDGVDRGLKSDEANIKPRL